MIRNCEEDTRVSVYGEVTFGGKCLKFGSEHASFNP